MAKWEVTKSIDAQLVTTSLCFGIRITNKSDKIHKKYLVNFKKQSPTVLVKYHHFSIPKNDTDIPVCLNFTALHTTLKSELNENTVVR